MCCTNNELEYVTEASWHYELEGISFTVHVVGVPSNHEYDRAFIDEDEASRYAESLAKRTGAIIAT